MKRKTGIKLAVSGGKGGVGKSMTASALAMFFAEKKKVVAIDADVDGPNLAIWLGGVKKWDEIEQISVSVKPVFDPKKCDGCGLCAKNCKFEAIEMKKNRPVLCPFLCEGCGLCETICPKGAIKLKPVKSGEIKIKKIRFSDRRFLLISGSLYPGETGSGKIVDEIKARAGKFSSDIQIIDSAPGTGCPVNAALRDVDFVVLVTEPTPSAISDLKRVLEVVNYFNLPFSIVINKWDVNFSLSKKIEKEFSGKILGKISYDKNILNTVSEFRPILGTNLKAKKELEIIYNKLLIKLYA